MTEIVSRPPVVVPDGPVPPQALEAERAVLAAMLLDGEAVARAIEMIDAPVFYRVAHQKIFEAMTVLFGRNEKIDLITLAEELRKRGELDAVGGAPALAQILDYAATSANVEQHAKIVHGKSVLRSLIKATSEIQQEAYGGHDETAAILDRAEQRIFQITDQRVRQGFISMKELMMPTMKTIEELAERKALVTGVPSGYEDLDKMTSGFQRSDLVIIAGRPSMGKTSFAMNIAENAAIQHGKHVAILSLEMSKEQIALRLLCSQSEVPLYKVRSGHLSEAEFRRLVNLTGGLYKAGIMIDDTAAPTVLEIRAKCRRLKAENRLDMALIDYLQLIRGSGRVENRTQEISQITRALKGLAKELDIPIVALSQLSRAPEGRGQGERRPQLSDLRESGCLTADTLVWRADNGTRESLGDLYEHGEKDIPVWTMDDDLRIRQGVMTKVFSSGVKPVFELRMASGLSVKASANHPFYRMDGWRRLDELQVGERLASPRSIPDPIVELLATTRRNPNVDTVPVEVWRTVRATMRTSGVTARQLVSRLSTAYCDSSFYKRCPSRERLNRVAQVLESPELRRMATSDIFWDTIAAIEPLGEQPVFDATVPGTHNFIANGVIAHNSIEQDADVVLFVFREEMYKRDDPTLRGKADIIIAKQRNGPVGDVKLTFLHEFTKFVPYSPVMPGETDPGF